jgi:hypothetical protein
MFLRIASAIAVVFLAIGEGRARPFCSGPAHGEFSLPIFVHDHVPTGIPVMAERRAQFSYSFEELFEGGRVRIQDHESRLRSKQFMSFLDFRSKTTHRHQ